MQPDNPQRKRPKTEQERQQEQLSRDIREVFGTPAGKRVAHWLVGLGRLYAVTFRRNAEGAFLEGRRSVAIDVVDELKTADPALCLDILGLGFQAPDEDEGKPEFAASSAEAQGQGTHGGRGNHE